LAVDYAAPLSDALAAAFDKVLARSNAFLMKSHGVMVCAREGVGRALEFTEMLEAMAKSLAVAHGLGNVDVLAPEALDELEQVLKTRGLGLPGAPGAVKSLRELYRR